MTEANSLRLFVAAGIPAPVRQELGRIQDGLRRTLPDDAVRWTRPEGIHLTLKFLGEVAGDRVEALAASLAGGLKGQQGPELRLAGLGSFGEPRRLRVLWVGLEGDTAGLSLLARGVDAALEAQGIPPEKRPFAGHLTLGRVRERVRPEARARLHRALAAAPSPAALEFRVESTALMSSRLGPGGARYQALRVFPLG